MKKKLSAFTGAVKSHPIAFAIVALLGALVAGVPVAIAYAKLRAKYPKVAGKLPKFGTDRVVNA